MNGKTMEGITGARTNMNLMNTPMRVYRDARRRGDLAVMERAMGYAGEFAGKAEEYKCKAEEGMKEEAEEVREKARLEAEKFIQKQKEERKEQEEGIERKKSQEGDVLEISEKGKAMIKEQREAGGGASEGKDKLFSKQAVSTKAGDAVQTEIQIKGNLSIFENTGGFVGSSR